MFDLFKSSSEDIYSNLSEEKILDALTTKEGVLIHRYKIRLSYEKNSYEKCLLIIDDCYSSSKRSIKITLDMDLFSLRFCLYKPSLEFRNNIRVFLSEDDFVVVNSRMFFAVAITSFTGYFYLIFDSITYELVFITSSFTPDEDIIYDIILYTNKCSSLIRESIDNGINFKNRYIKDMSNSSSYKSRCMTYFYKDYYSSDNVLHRWFWNVESDINNKGIRLGDYEFKVTRNNDNKNILMYRDITKDLRFSIIEFSNNIKRFHLEKLSDDSIYFTIDCGSMLNVKINSSDLQMFSFNESSGVFFDIHNGDLICIFDKFSVSNEHKISSIKVFGRKFTEFINKSISKEDLRSKLSGKFSKKTVTYRDN